MNEPTLSDRAIRSVNDGNLSYCKFLSANDTGETNAHQSGIYVAKEAIPILFGTTGQKGENMDRWVKVKWQDDFETDARFIYYGKRTRNEYRITHFGKGFPFLNPEHTGDLFVLTKQDEETYAAFVLGTEDEINGFLDAFGLSPAETGRLIQKESLTEESRVSLAINEFIKGLHVEFPSSEEMSAAARGIYEKVYDHSEDVTGNPDKLILRWTDMEFKLFRRLESYRYGDVITKGFSDFDTFINVALKILNSRKSRAGKSLEHHLSALFDGNRIAYDGQVVTEGNKKPDFIFPGAKAYHSSAFPSNQLVSLAAKTTCKDRWRQVINEADRIPVKHLFTFQQGISTQQLNEMESEHVVLVVPREYLTTFPEAKRDGIWTLEKFIGYVKEKEAAVSVKL